MKPLLVAVAGLLAVLAGVSALVVYRLSAALPALAFRDDRICNGLADRPLETQRRFLTAMLGHFEREHGTSDQDLYRMQGWLVSGDGVLLAASDAEPLPRPWATLPRPEPGGPAVETLVRGVVTRLNVARVGESPTRFLVLRSRLVPSRLGWRWLVGAARQPSSSAPSARPR